jgi:hypothetical protein
MIADATLGSRVLDSASAALAIVALTAALAWAKDFGFAVVGGELTRGKREAVAVAVAIPYALAILLAAAFFDRRWDSPWSALALGAFGAALFGAAGAFRLRGGQIAGLGAILLAHAVMLGRLFHRAVLPNDAIWGAALFFALAIGVERLLARWRGLAPDFGPGAPTPQARAVLLGVATFVFMLALHRINILEARWSTAVWSGVGAAIVSLGFAWRSAVYRRTALALFGVCLARVFLFDIWQLGEFYRWLAFVSLGLTLLGVAALYARFSEEMRKWL